ncbi:hypothetical protein Vqi01_58870 [Micromonospora qiuiae]|uniref:Uncharacterized protein n=1 Tax=Micromonospora qiuiae TaxID=502268 RepID=A0ABQ4JK28_9ACTN|nr:hypothetical protein [Micromonospora qiuiae]GIJ30725.1 hypothetical protein Vqi01_58870 [Micromonospora qiuiae]
MALEVLDAFAAPVAEDVRSDLVAAVLAEQPASNWHNHFNVVLGSGEPTITRPSTTARSDGNTDSARQL